MDLEHQVRWKLERGMLGSLLIPTTILIVEKVILNNWMRNWQCNKSPKNSYIFYFLPLILLYSSHGKRLVAVEQPIPFGSVRLPGSASPPIYFHNSLDHQNILNAEWLEMAYKRHRLGSRTSSRAPPSSRPQSFSQLSSVPRSTQASSPGLPAASQRTRISLRPQSSQSSFSPSRQDENVIRAGIVESDAETKMREDADALNEIIMAVDLRDRGTIGCAYYVAREEKLYLMEDIKMGGLEIIETLRIHIQPSLILISNRSDEKLEDYLNREDRGIDRGDEASMEIPLLYRNSLTSRLLDDIFGSYVLDSRPSSEFHYENAKNKLLNLELSSDKVPNIIFTTPENELTGKAANGQVELAGLGRQGRLMRLAGWIDLDSRLTVRPPAGLSISISTNMTHRSAVLERYYNT
jgi:hypothetical protein